jgi:hypothetical protein
MFVILLRDTEKTIYCDGLQTSYNGPIVVLRALNILINPKASNKITLDKKREKERNDKPQKTTVPAPT